MNEPSLHDHDYEAWSYRQYRLDVEDERDVDSRPGETTADFYVRRAEECRRRGGVETEENEMSEKGNAQKALNDLARYNRMTVGGNTDGCLAIEKEWGLDGFPPSVVTSVLSNVGSGETIERAMERLDEM